MIEIIRQIAELEGLNGWDFEVHPNDSYCWVDSKTIQVAERHSKHLAMWLHELAHALRYNDGSVPYGDKHDGRWADIFTRLVGLYTHPICDLSQCVIFNKSS